MEQYFTFKYSTSSVNPCP